MPSKKDLLTTSPEDNRRKRFHRMLGTSSWPARAGRYNRGVARAGLGPERFRGPEEMAGQAWDIQPFQTPLQRATTRSDILAQQRRPTEEPIREAAQVRAITSPLDIAEARSASDIAMVGAQRAGLEQEQEFARQAQPTTLGAGRTALLQTQQAPSITGIDNAITQATTAMQAAFQAGDEARVRFFEQQIADLQNQRMALTSAQIPEQAAPEAPQGFRYEAPPAPAGLRLNFLAGQSNRAKQGADMIMANNGLTNLVGTPEQPGMLANLVNLKPWDEDAMYIMQDLLSRLRVSLQQAQQQAQTPEEKQQILSFILDSIKTNPAYAQIFQWQDADRPFSEESGGLRNLSPLYAGGRFASQMIKGQNPAEAAQLARQIVSLVEGAGNMPVQ